MHITIIGTGLIGCSMGMALKKQGHQVSGVDKSQKNIDDALFMGGIDDAMPLEVAIPKTDLAILCVPVDAVIDLLIPVLDLLPDHAVVMDMGSTKADICKKAEEHPRRDRFVAVHPMAGVEHSGPLAAHVDLFLHARMIICDPQRSSTTALNVVLGIVQELKMKAIFMDSHDHDRQLALVSHLPQFIAYALSALEDFSKEDNKDWVELGGGGLQSSIRLGKSDAEMWMPIFRQNRTNLMEYIDGYVAKLLEMKKLVVSNNTDELNKLIKTANKNYEKLNYRNNHPRPLVPNKGAPKVFYS